MNVKMGGVSSRGWTKDISMNAFCEYLHACCSHVVAMNVKIGGVSSWGWTRHISMNAVCEYHAVHMLMLVCGL